jgi:putative addiction module component (TIGR02574 family)
MPAEKILQDALALPAEDRARIADALLDSLEPEGGEALAAEEWEAAWSVELERRLRDFDEGRVKPIPFEEAMARARARLARP